MVVSTQDRRTAFWRLLSTPEPPHLDQGSRAGVLPADEIREIVGRLDVGPSLTEGGRGTLGAVALLYHDHHNEAHDLVQDLTDSDGCLVHAILHRREPDFWNARYWFRRAGDHPVYRVVMDRLPAGGAPEVAAMRRRLTLAGTLDADGLVDACEGVYGRPPTDPLAVFLRGVQQAEFEALVAHLLA